MKFGRAPTNEAVGAILAHSHKTPSGVLKKGRLLTNDDIANLITAGVTEIVTARLEPGDISEDEAAHRIATAIAGSNARVAAPFTGRANIFAEQDGLALIPAELINRINTIDEALTIATVAPFERVRKGQMLATVKVITFSVPEQTVRAAEQLIGDAERISTATFGKKSTGLILTKLSGTKTSILTKRRKVMQDRLAAMGNELSETLEVEHDQDAVRGAIEHLKSKGCDPILVFAASAIVDRGDIIPSAIEAAGGEIIHLGMPVDPGNLLLAGKLGKTDVIGVPSCAGSPKLNGFDWVLERRLADIPVEAKDIAAMGVGGLLMEIEIRPQARTGDDAQAARTEPKIACILLAAGRSTRMGRQNKLLADIAGKKMVRCVAETILASRAQPLIVVTGHESENVRAELADLDVSFAHNPDFASGIASSLKEGLKSLPRDVDGVLIALGDMPNIQPEHIDRIISAFSPKEHRSIVVPTFKNQRGNPVLWSSEFFSAMQEAAGDVGAKALINQNADQVVEVEIASDAVVSDIDTPELLDALRANSQ